MRSRASAALSPLVLTALLACSAAASAQTAPFDWIPSGRLDTADRSSRLRFDYQGETGRPATVELPWKTGRRQEARGLMTGEERFVVPIATDRSGPIAGALVLRRLWDTGQGAARLEVSVGGRDVGVWETPDLSSERSWIESYFVVPREVWIGEAERTPASVSIRIRSSIELPSYEYAFFISPGWQGLGAERTGSLRVTSTESRAPEDSVIDGVVAYGQRELDVAAERFGTLVSDTDLGRSARAWRRRIECRRALDRVLPETVKPRAAQVRAIALYAAANGFWEEAIEAGRLHLRIEPADPDATYRLAEALAYGRRPVSEWAPLMERAGDLWCRGQAVNEVEVLVALQTQPYPKDPLVEPRLCRPLSIADVEALTRDWRFCEQIVYGASRGSYRLRSTFRVDGPKDPDWVMHLGWLFGPPDTVVPVRGTFDYAMCFAGYGSSHTGGVDCGIAGSAASQIGPQRGWEVFLHEWNHQFDWIAINGEQLPGYPVTHDSDGCGKQPIPSMGVGHLASLYYYVTPAEYRRHEGADPERPGSHLRHWGVGGLTAPPLPDELPLERALLEAGYVDVDRLTAWRQAWEAEQERAGRPPADSPIEQVPAPRPPSARPFEDFLRERWLSSSLLDELWPEGSEAFLSSRQAGPNGSGIEMRPIESETDFVDLAAALEGAPPKALAFAETWVHSPLAREVRIWLGYNDRAALWVNGARVHQGRYIATAKWEDAARTDMVASSARLEAGWNRLVVLAERLGGGFGFSLRIADFDGEPLADLEHQAQRPEGPIAQAARPVVGPTYDWDEVREDYRLLLPELTAEDLRRITSLPVELHPHRFFISGASAFPGARLIEAPGDEDRALNNYLDWDHEAVAAIRFWRDGELRDLLLIRPEYFEAYLTLAGPEGALRERVLGRLTIEEPTYASTPSRTGRRDVIVVAAQLPERFPLDEEDLLVIPE